MKPRPERLRMRWRPKKFFEAKATMYEAEARHVRQDSYRSGKTGKSRGICVVRERSGKMILDLADCRYL